jgi:nuclear transport factor 2 (NTF2) superfamily protein
MKEVAIIPEIPPFTNGTAAATAGLFKSAPPDRVADRVGADIVDDDMNRAGIAGERGRQTEMEEEERYKG